MEERWHGSFWKSSRVDGSIEGPRGGAGCYIRSARTCPVWGPWRASPQRNLEAVHRGARAQEWRVAAPSS